MNVMAAQITGDSIVFQQVVQTKQLSKHPGSVLPFIYEENPPPVTGRFFSQMASIAECISISGRHHVWYLCPYYVKCLLRMD